MTNSRLHRERGATALIIVLFSVLLLVIIAVGFMRAMTAEQRRAIDDELSQGAYDSALAGVEDGKRALISCLNGDAAVCAIVDKQSCDTVSAVGLVQPRPNGEVYLKNSSGSGVDFEQAYTCVKIVRNTDDYTGKLALDSSKMVHLKAVSEFNKIEVSWYVQNNHAEGSAVVKLDDPAGFPFSELTKWDGNTNTKPPVMRAQLIQFTNLGFKLDELDNATSTHTLYLYPRATGLNTFDFSSDSRLREGGYSVSPVKCETSFSKNDGYACKVTLSLPDPMGKAAKTRDAYLRLTTIYGDADYRIVLKKDSDTVAFDGIQPLVDSTGRAADVFRRVSARVEQSDPNEALLYPRATIDMTNNFCKNFVITDATSGYSNLCP